MVLTITVGILQKSPWYWMQKNKDYIYVAGSFNDWKPDNDYAMTKDPNSDKFWIELSGLTQVK